MNRQPTTNDLVILRASPQQADELTRIAIAAKSHWGYPSAWLEAWRPSLTITPEFIEAHEVYRAVQAGITVGFIALSFQAQTAAIEHLWVLPEAMGSGVGRALFRHAVERARALGARRLQVESDPNAERFYQKMGARRCGERLTNILGEARSLPLLEMEL